MIIKSNLIVVLNLHHLQRVLFDKESVHIECSF